MNAIDLTNITLIYFLNNTPLLQGGENSLISTAQACEFGLDRNYVAKRHGGKQCIYV